MRDKALVRFLRSFRQGPNGCIEWRKSIDGSGYGKFYINGRYVGAHKFMYELFEGKVAPGLCVLHSCDNPCCVNPGHLVTGTPKDNTIDRNNKGRGYIPSGELNGNAKLSQQEVLEIKLLSRAGVMPIYKLASIYGVSSATISFIKNGTTWGHD